jgi:hypothetical protein
MLRFILKLKKLLKVKLNNLRPFVLYSDKFLDAISWFFKVGGIALFPVIVLREKYKNSQDHFWIKRGKEVINHESIHFQQALELGVLPFYILYVLEWFFKLPFYGAKAYENISFEREAYGNDSNLKYLETRKRYNWIHLIANNS